MIIKKLTLSILFFLIFSVGAMEKEDSSILNLDKLPTELIFNILVSIDNLDGTAKTIKNLSQTNKNFKELFKDIEFTGFLINHLAVKFNKNAIYVALYLRTEGTINWIQSEANNSSEKAHVEDTINMISKELIISKLLAAAALGTEDAKAYLSKEIKNSKDQQKKFAQELLKKASLIQTEPLLTEPEYLLLDLADNDDQLSIFAIKCLLETGIKINIQDDRPTKTISFLPERATEKTPLIIAAESGNIKAVKLFIKYKYSDITKLNRINIKALGFSALEYAIKKGSLNIIKILWPFRKPNKDLALLFSAIDAEKNRVDIIDFLINQNIDINKYSTGYRETALMQAAAGFDINIVNLLIKNGADINSENKYGETALVFAIKAGNLEIVKLLLSSGANVNLIDKFYNNYTPLMIAIDKKYPKIALELIYANADINKVVELQTTDKNSKKEIRCATNLALEKAEAEIDANKLHDWQELIKVLEEKNSVIL